MEVKSDGPNCGCTFTLYLNLSGASCGSSEQLGNESTRIEKVDLQDEEANRLPHSLKVLVVDDSKLNRKILCKVLQKYVTDIEEVSCKALCDETLRDCCALGREWRGGCLHGAISTER